MCAYVCIVGLWQNACYLQLNRHQFQASLLDRASDALELCVESSEADMRWFGHHARIPAWRLQSDALSWRSTTHAEDSANGEREHRGAATASSEVRRSGRQGRRREQGRDVASDNARAGGRTVAHAWTSGQPGRRPPCGRDPACSGCHRRAALRLGHARSSRSPPAPCHTAMLFATGVEARLGKLVGA
jgi:hypothetical protein